MSAARPVMAPLLRLVSRLPRLRCESEELLHLDLMRFAAAMAVVVYHFRNQWMFGDVRGTRIAGFENMSLAVDLFFVISGIVITHVYRDLDDFGRFLQKRFARLAPLHYATLLFYLLLGFVALHFGVEFREPWKYRPDCLSTNLFFLQGFGLCSYYSFNHVSWSISAEMIAYVLFPLFLLLLRCHRALPLGLALMLVVLLFLAGPIGPEQRMWHEMTYDVGIVRVVPAFLIGMTLCACRDVLERLPAPRLMLAAIVALFVAGLVMQVPRGLLVPLVYAMAAAALACDVQRLAGGVVRWLAPLGALTYGIYMLHPLVRTALRPAFQHMEVPNNLAVAIMFCLVPIFAYLSLFLFEKPMRALLSKRWQGRKSYSMR